MEKEKSDQMQKNEEQITERHNGILELWNKKTFSIIRIYVGIKNSTE